jgi:hypothetical protein
MFSFFEILILIAILFRISMVIYRVVNKVSSYQDQQSSKVDSALFVRKSTTGAEYLEMATNAMIYENKSLEEVKQLLRDKGMYEENINLYAKKAKERYDKWVSENGQPPQLTAMQQYELLHKQPAPTDSAIMLSSTPGEDHAHHFCALIGKPRYFTDWGREILYKATDAALKKDPVIQNDAASISQITFKHLGGAEFNPQLRVVVVKGQREAVFPYLNTDVMVPFQTKNILEWENSNLLEAEIEGTWNNGLSLGFFATDYAVNKHIYKTRQDINVKLSAFVLDISCSERSKDDLDSRENIPGYWPSKYYGSNSYFEFEGVLLKLTTADVDILSKGGILTLKLIDNKQGKDLIVDAYMNITNMTASSVLKDLNVTGVLWFQGELAE